jgi:uncharacterized protein DUF6044/membrane protein YfhO
MTESRIRRVLRWTADFVDRHPALVFLIWSIAISFPYWAFGKYSYVRIVDNADSTLAIKLGMVYSFVNYGISYWWSLGLCGLDLHAQAVAGNLDTILFLAFPGWLAYGLLMFIQRFIAGYFTYTLLRKTLDMNVLASFYAGAAFALYPHNWLNSAWGGFTLYDGLVLPGLPLLIYLLYISFRTEGRRKWIGVIVTGCFVAYGSYFVFTFFIVPFVMIWLMTINAISWRELWKPAILFIIVWLLLEIPLQLPVYYYSTSSYRMEWSYNASSAGWGLLVNHNYEFFRQLVPIFALFAVSIFARLLFHKRLYVIYILFVAILLIVKLNSQLMAFVSMVLPLTRGVQFDRLYLVLPFLIAVIPAFVFDGLISKFTNSNTTISHNGNMVLRWVSYGSIVVLFLILTFDAALSVKKMLGQMVHGSNYQGMLEHPGLSDMRADENEIFRNATVTIAGRVIRANGDSPERFAFNPSLSWAHGLETVDGYTLLYPLYYKGLWSKILEPSYPKSGPDMYGYHEHGRYVYLYLPPDTVRISKTPFVFKEYFNLRLLSLLNVKYISSIVPITDSALSLVYSGQQDLEKTAWASLQSSTSAMLLDRDYLRPVLWIYKNKYAFPRFFITGKVALFDTDVQLLDALGKASLDDLSTTSFVLSKDCPKMLSEASVDSHGTIHIEEYKPDRIKLNVSVSNPCMVIASANYSDWWRAEVDGKKVPIIRVDYALLGIPLMPGRHSIVLRYKPSYLF